MPKKLKKPFTAVEIKGAIKSLKNGKSEGIDNACGELLKYGPDAISSEIAKMFNEISDLFRGIGPSNKQAPRCSCPLMQRINTNRSA